MSDWYRLKSWTRNDEEHFFKKLNRAKKDGRAQYLKIQAIELVQTEDKALLRVAEGLLNKILTEHPDDNFNRGSAFSTLGDIISFERITKKQKTITNKRWTLKRFTRT